MNTPADADARMLRIAEKDEYAQALVMGSELARVFGADLVLATEVSGHPIKRGLDALWAARPPEKTPRTGRVECHRYRGEPDTVALSDLDHSPGYHAFFRQVEEAAAGIPRRRELPPVLAMARRTRGSLTKLLRAMRPWRDAALRDAVRLCVYDEYLVKGARDDGTMSRVMDMTAHASAQLKRPVAALIATVPVDFVHYGSLRSAGMELPVLRREMEADSGYRDHHAMRYDMGDRLWMLGPDGIMPEHDAAYREAHAEEIARYEECMRLMGERAAAEYEARLPAVAGHVKDTVRRVNALLGGFGRHEWWDRPLRGGIIIANGKDKARVGRDL